MGGVVVRTFLAQLLTSCTWCTAGATNLGLPTAIAGAELFIYDSMKWALLGVIEVRFQMATQAVVTRESATTFWAWC